MSYEEERIVKMTFDNAQFTKDVEATIAQLEKLEKSMNIKGSSTNAFTTLARSADSARPSIDSYANSIDTVTAKFSKLQIIGATVLSELTKAALSAGKKLYDSTLGQILSGGSRRALNLENARFKIEGLEGDWDQLYKSMDYAVSGTAYGLDQAANVAAQLLASGISYERVLEGSNEQLSLMDTALRGVSGVAAMTGRSYDDVGHIFTTVAGNGRLFAMQLNQISAYGLNAAKALADYYNEIEGVSDYTEAKIREMVSQGKVSFADFAQAMDSAFGEHAKDANKTFTGALDNMKAALSRTGEKFLTPFHEFERELYNTIRPLINVLNTQLSPVVNLWKVLLEYATDFVTTLGNNEDFVYAIQYALIDIEKVILNIAQAIFEVAGTDLPNITLFAFRLKNFFHDLQLDEETGKKFRDIIKSIIGVLQMMGSIIKGIWIIAKPILGAAITYLARLFNISSDGYDILYRLAPIFDRIVVAIANLIVLKLPVFVDNCVKAFKIFTAILKGAAIAGLIVVSVIVEIAVKIKDLIMWLWQFKNIAVTTFKVVGTGFVGLAGIIMSVAGAISSFISTTFGGFTSMATNLTEPIIDSQQAVIEQQREYTEAVEETTEAIEDMSDAQEEYTGKHADGPDASGKGPRHKSDEPSSGDTIGTLISTQTDADVQMMSKAVEKEKKEFDAYIHAQKEMAKRARTLKDALHEMYGDDKTPLQEFVGKVTDIAVSIKDKIMQAAEWLSEFMQNGVYVFFTTVGVVVISIITTVVGAILNTIAGIGLLTLGAGINAIGSGILKVALALTAILDAMVPIMLAFGALVAILGVVDYYSDLERIVAFFFNMTAMLTTIFEYAIKILGLVVIVEILRSIEYTIYSLASIIGGINPKSPKKNILENINKFLSGITALLGAILLFVVITGNMKPGVLIQGGIAITVTLILVSAMLIGLSRAMAKTMEITTGAEGKLFKGGKLFRSTKTVFGGMSEFLLGLSLLLVSLVAAIYALELVYERNPNAYDRAEKTLFTVGIGIGILTIAIGWLERSFLKAEGTDYKATTKRMHSICGSISKLLLSLSFAILTISAAMILVSLIDEDRFMGSVGAVLAIFAIFSLVLSVLILGVDGMNTNMVKLGNGKKGDVFSIKMAAITDFIRTIASAILSFAAAIAIIAMVAKLTGNTEMIWAVSSLAGFVVLLSIVVGLLINNVEKFSTKAPEKAQTKFEKHMAAVKGLIHTISLALLAVAGALLITSSINSDKLLVSAGALLLTMTGLSVIVFGLMAMVNKFVSLDAPKGRDPYTQLKHKTNSVVKLISAMSGMAFAISAALLMMNAVKIEGLWKKAAVSMSMLAVMALTIVGFMAVIEIADISKDQTNQTISILMAMSGLLLAISASFALLGSVAWSDMSSSVGYIIGAFGAVMTIMGVAVLIAKQGKNSKSILSAAAVMFTVTTLIFAIGQLFGLIDSVNMDNVSKALPMLITAFSGITAILLSIALIVKVAKDGNVLAAAGIMLGLMAVVWTIGDFIRSIGGVNWSSAQAAFPTIVAVMSGITALMITLTVMSAIGNPGTILATAALMGAMAVVFGVLSGIFYAVSKIPTESMLPAMIGINSALLLVGATVVLLAVFGSAAAAAIPFVGMISVMFVAIGAMFIAAAALLYATANSIDMIMDSLTRFLTFLNDFVHMDWSTTADTAAALGTFFSSLTLPLLGMIPAIPALLALAIGLPLLAIGLMSLGSIDAEQMGAVGASLGVLLTSLMMIVQNDFDMAALMSFGLQLSITSGLLTAGVTLMFASLTLMNIVNYSMIPTFTRFIATLNILLAIVAGGEMTDHIQELIPTAGILVGFGALLLVAGALILAGGLLFSLGSLSFMAGIYAMSIVIPIVMETFSDDMTARLNFATINIMKFALLLLVAGATLTIGSAIFIAGALVFTIASTLFMTGAIAFNAGIDLVCEASDRVCESINTIAETFLNCVETLNTCMTDIYDTGHYIIEGLTEGLTDNDAMSLLVGGAMTAGGNLIEAFRNVFDINSPSRVFAEMGWYNIAGLVQGLEEGLPMAEAWAHAYVDETDEVLGEGMAAAGTNSTNSLFAAITSGFQDSGIMGVLAALGERLGINFGGSFSETAGNLIKKFLSTVGGQLDTKTQMQLNQALQAQTRLQALLQDSSISAEGKRNIQTQLTALEGTIEGLKGTNEIYAVFKGLGDKLQDFDLSKLSTGGGGGGSYGTYTPVDVGTSYSGVGGGSTAGLAADTGNLVGNTITTNNTYNFTQNNYSPEPIDRTELYTQTNNQLNSWYKWLRSQ